jgi:hypothetical protein
VDWPTALVAIGASFASAAAATTVAVWTVRSQADRGREDREHDRELARVARRQARRGPAYVDLLTALQRLMTGVERTVPIFTAGTPPDPPKPMSDRALWRLNALTAAFASDDLQEMVRAWNKRADEFYAEAWLLKRIQDYGVGRPPSEVKAAYGAGEVEQWKKVESVRRDLREKVEAIGKRVRSELEE